MTRETAKELLPIIQAFAEGKQIEYSNDNGKTWFDLRKFEWYYEVLYRIKPAPKYRPFKNIDECWNEMKKHEPFGWISDGFYKTTISVKPNSIVLTISSDEYSYENVFHTFKFIDGTPFGVKEE